MGEAQRRRRRFDDQGKQVAQIVVAALGGLAALVVALAVALSLPAATSGTYDGSSQVGLSPPPVDVAASATRSGASTGAGAEAAPDAPADERVPGSGSQSAESRRVALTQAAPVARTRRAALLEAVRDAGITVPNPASKTVRAAKLTCRHMDAGTDRATFVAEFARGAEVTLAQARDFLAAATRLYCPEHHQR